MRKRAILSALELLVWVAPVAPAQQQPGDFFGQNCTSCHALGGGRLTGPNLKDVTQRKDRAWLERFVQNPKAVLDSGDPYVQQLLQEARGVVMLAVPGMTSEWPRAVLDLLEAESKLPKSQFQLNAEDVNRKRERPADLPLTAAEEERLRRKAAWQAQQVRQIYEEMVLKKSKPELVQIGDAPATPQPSVGAAVHGDD